MVTNFFFLGPLGFGFVTICETHCARYEINGEHSPAAAGLSLKPIASSKERFVQQRPSIWPRV